ncbi:MAG TPA: tetratricopeptide repeat protein [Ktedonobacteraceae bacterium]|nr:tetratricopeptide repeat protein [Ktedonobacteraceae bacterium]
MSQMQEMELMLLRARLNIQEGRPEDALTALETIQTDDPEKQREIAYLCAWCYHQQGKWTEAVRYLSQYTPNDIEDNWNDADHNERERRAFYLLWLGNVAVNLSHYADASRHYEQCLKILRERRVHLPRVLLKARCGLGLTSTMNGFYLAAIQHYEDALQLIKDDLESEDATEIYYGLADAYRLAGKFEQAYTYGKMALRLYEKRSQRYWEGRMHNLLGRICFQMGQYQDASDHYMEALSAATLDNSPGMMMINFVALADLRLSEERLEEALRFCQRAREAGARVNDEHLCGLMYLVCGKVVHAQAEQTEGARHQELLEESIQYFEQALEQLSRTQATTNLAELHGWLAKVYEELGRHQDAVEHWKHAYSSLSTSKGPSWWY